jgi:hypothetical protein
LIEKTMNRTFRALIWLMWAALPLIALRYWMVWDQLPIHMATHFNAAGQANGWMTREISLAFALGITLFLLTIFTAILYLAIRQQAPDRMSWAMLGFFYLVMAFMFHVNNSILAYNLEGKPVEMGPFLIALPFAIVMFVAIYMGSKRGEALPAGQLVAEEVHASALWALVLLIPLAIEVFLFRAIPVPAVRAATGLVGALMLICAVFAWQGFQYRFSQGGVEIRTLGFRLRSIPITDIREYGVEPWSALRGYGIRGVGRCRGYVWGNQVVHIKTKSGDVFLGHSEPERIIRDLDAIRSFAH